MKNETPSPVGDKTEVQNSRLNVKHHLSKVTILSWILAVVALLGLALAGWVWHQNRDLKSDMTARDTQIQTLTKEVNTLKKATQVPADATSPTTLPKSTTTTAPVTSYVAKVGQTVDTDSGSLLINSYAKNSLHEISASSTATDQNLLRVNITLTNTTKVEQTYNPAQFTYIDSSKVLNQNMGQPVPASGYDLYLKTITLEPGGSVTSNVFFNNYDHGQGTFQWTNSNQQTVKAALAGL